MLIIMSEFGESEYINESIKEDDVLQCKWCGSLMDDRDEEAISKGCSCPYCGSDKDSLRRLSREELAKIAKEDTSDERLFNSAEARNR